MKQPAGTWTHLSSRKTDWTSQSICIDSSKPNALFLNYSLDLVSQLERVEKGVPSFLNTFCFPLVSSSGQICVGRWVETHKHSPVMLSSSSAENAAAHGDLFSLICLGPRPLLIQQFSNLVLNRKLSGKDQESGVVEMLTCYYFLHFYISHVFLDVILEQRWQCN